MTGTELIDALKASGTGEGKLAPGRALLKAKPSASADEVYQALVAAKVNAITLGKAESLLADAKKQEKPAPKPEAPAPVVPPLPRTPQKKQG